MTRTLPPPPLRCRKLQAQIALKWIDREQLARLAGINYTYASCVLNGRRIDPSALAKLAKLIAAAPLPKEAA